MAVFKRDMVDINLETGNIHRSFLKHSIGYKDQQADHFGIRAYRNGEPVNLTGVSIQGIFMPPQGDPIAITSGNIVNFNEAEVVLPQACYNYDGQFTLAIKLVDPSNAVTGTMRIVDGMVDNTHASGTVAPVAAIPSYQEVLSTYEQAIAAINKTVRFDAVQSLTDTQKATARGNISAPSVADLQAETTAREAADTAINNAIGTVPSGKTVQGQIDTLESGKVPKTTTVNGHALSGNVTVTKSDVGLGNVDNTSDVNKPVSTAQQAAIDAEAATRAAADADLKSALGETDSVYTGFLYREIGITTYPFEYKDNKAYYTSSDPVVEDEPNTEGWWRCKIPCTEGDVFHVKISNGNSSYRPWAFVGSDMSLISKAQSNSVDATLIAPENAAYLLCNVRTTVSESVHEVTKGVNSKQDKLTFDSKPIKNSNNPVTSDGIFNALADIAEPYYQWIDNKAVATNGETVGDPVDASGRRCAVIDLTGVECVTLLNATGSTTYRPWCFIDDSGNKISTCTLSVEATRRLYKPTGATKLVINTTLATQTKLYIGSYVDNVALLDIASDIHHYGCLEKYMSNGGWGTTGYLNRQYRTFTKPDLVLDFDATIRCTEDYQFGVIYDDNGTAKDSSWTRVFNVKHGSAFSVVTRKATEDTTSVADVHEFAMNVTVEKTVNPLSMPVFITDKARIVMHRGYMADTTNIPENSIPAFNKAGEIGAWAVETDVQETSDGYYVLMHDNTVDRTTTGTGSISSMTYAQTQELYLRGGDGTLKIPSLSDFLATCKKWNLVGLIEIKSILRGKTSMQEIVDIVHEYGLDDRVMYTFNSTTDMDYYSALGNNAPMSFNVSSSEDYESAIDTALKYLHCGIAYQSGSKMTSAVAKKCHAHNIFVNTWISSAWDAQSSYFARGCDIVTSNSNAVRPVPTT